MKDSVHIHHAEALAWLKTQRTSSADALLCDPPAGIKFMSKTWDSDRGGRDMWIRWLARIMRQALRVLRPGAYGLVWALPRTAHWTATALENAGFEVRDVVVHMFGNGYAKSTDVSRVIDDAAGAERQVVGPDPEFARRNKSTSKHGLLYASMHDRPECPVTAPATPEAERWDGYGTALRPGGEHWILVRKPLAGTIPANAVAHGTGGLNVDGCRLPRDYAERSESWKRSGHSAKPDAAKIAAPPGSGITLHPDGGWPANVVVDEEVARLLDAQSGEWRSAPRGPRRGAMGFKRDTDAYDNPDGVRGAGDYGGASRFFKVIADATPAELAAEAAVTRFLYCAKPSRFERDFGCEHLPLRLPAETVDRYEDTPGIQSPRAGAGRSGDGVHNHHATIKAIKLATWLATLILPPPRADGQPRRLLNPFAGSGGEAIGAMRAGFDIVDSVEQEAEYLPILRARVARWAEVPREMTADEVRERADRVVNDAQASLFGKVGT